MKNIYQASKIRSWCFNIFLYLGTFILCVLFLPTMFMTTKGSGCFPRIWSKIMRKALKVICNIEIEIKGLENLPKKPGYIVASKHQSAMETVLFHGYSFYLWQDFILSKQDVLQLTEVVAQKQCAKWSLA